MIYTGDCLTVMATLDAESIDAIAEARLNGTQKGMAL